MGTYDDTPVAWGNRLADRERFVGEAIGASLHPVGGAWTVEFRDKSANVRGVRPATPLEVRMWGLLCAVNESHWDSAYYDNAAGTPTSGVHPSIGADTGKGDGA